MDKRRGHQPYPEGEIWTDFSDPPEFRRFLDLRIGQFSAGLDSAGATRRTAFVLWRFGGSNLLHPRVSDRGSRSLGCSHEKESVGIHHLNESGDQRVLGNLFQVCHRGRAIRDGGQQRRRLGALSGQAVKMQARFGISLARRVSATGMGRIDRSCTTVRRW